MDERGHVVGGEYVVGWEAELRWSFEICPPVMMMELLYRE